MKKGFFTIMAAQFFSSLADNALFVAAVELLKSGGAAEWQRAALVPMFALFYVVLAPFVGAFADALPKGKVMFMSNAIKVVGCLMMLFGTHPLLAYAVVGLGAAAYSPAKYGILTELLPPISVGQSQRLDRGFDHHVHHFWCGAGWAVDGGRGVSALVGL
jgi:LPLT family lysophospholipid transporter-like MFS transporter